MLRITQQQLADRLCITFQQVQKYERGANRISSSRLWEIAEALDAPVSHFFEGLTGPSLRASEVQGDIMRDRTAIALINAYYAMPKTQRDKLFDLAQVLGGESVAAAEQAEQAA
jgi:transcriptional regulator with XRE-family HTH domain